ncbi:MAG: 23S rRNA (adenine(2503)-C(2))-methyltransferase RlmN [Ignavibacteria bacterium]|nr:23S rRNA (adenine(2503)-C(2))-methyltransferase RlmN [Ignavibacteria bacterium]
MITRNKKNLKGLTLEELRDFCTEAGEPKYRAKQLFSWMYGHLANRFEEMQNLPKPFREKLGENCSLNTLNYVTSEVSLTSNTKKYIFETLNGNRIESVLIPENRRNTLCISTQAGCPLDCKFCATALMGFKKNLSAGEIFDQYKLAVKDNDENKITNIVYMGMGEPLLNFNETIKSLQIFSDELTTGITPRRITISTAGIAPKIKWLADSGIKVKLALSLHSCFEDVRSKIMPVNKKYSLKENIEAINYYSKKTRTKITFEYVMLKDINDRNEDIKALTKLCRSLPGKVNVIPFNSLKHMTPGGVSAKLVPSSAERINNFVNELKANGITIMLRNTKGDDIAAACGQLAIKNKN